MEEEEKRGRLLTTDDVCKMLRRTPMSIHLYRKKKSMPYIKLPGGVTPGSKPPVRFYEKDIQSWAMQNNIPFYDF